MVHSQLVYIKHINSALQNHRRWASLHPVTITEKGDATTSMDSDSRQLIAKIFNGSAIPPILRPWAFWAYISLLAFHIVFILVFLCIKTLIQEQQTMSLLSAIFLTLIMTLTVVNIILVIYTGSKCHTESISRIMEQNKRDYIILFLIPALFMFSAFSMTAISWATFMADTHQFPALYDNSLLRIILEGVLFYIPITIILVAHMARKNSPFNDSIQKVLKERPHHYDRSRNYSRVKQDTGLETVPL
jgi:cytochrome bd-type quinol oxidase subunit 2